VTAPSCSSNDVYKRVIVYYEGWSSDRTCDAWNPNQMAVSGLTHINYAFATFFPYDGGWTVSLMSGIPDETEVVNQF
jgi:GH18 family chitinase